MRVLLCALFLLPSVLFAAQGEKPKWQRVYTGEDSIIEIDTSKVTFVEYSTARKVTFNYKTGRVAFRTILSKPEAMNEDPAVKYKTRLETIEFQCNETSKVELRRYPPLSIGRYRHYETTLQDDKGKVVKTYGRGASEEWKEVKFGSMMAKLAGSACDLIDEKRRNP
jgi:hypothetical protein